VRVGESRLTSVIMLASELHTVRCMHWCYSTLCALVLNASVG
jgi:hypothetical protein